MIVDDGHFDTFRGLCGAQLDKRARDDHPKVSDHNKPWGGNTGLVRTTVKALYFAGIIFFP